MSGLERLATGNIRSKSGVLSKSQSNPEQDYRENTVVRSL